MNESRIRIASLGATAIILCGIALVVFFLPHTRLQGQASPLQEDKLLALVQQSHRNQEAILAALEELRREFKLCANAQGQGSAERQGELRGVTESRASDTRQPIEGIGSQDAAVREIERLLKSQGPIGSAEEAWQLFRLPRTPPKYGAIEQFLRGWPESRKDLLYASVDEVVSRFGFPAQATMSGRYLCWEYAASQPLSGHPDRMALKITRNHVVDIVGMAKLK